MRNLYDTDSANLKNNKFPDYLEFQWDLGVHPFPEALARDSN